MKYCSKCGIQSNDVAAFCTNCGTAFGDLQPPPDNTWEQQSDNTSLQQPDNISPQQPNNTSSQQSNSTFQQSTYPNPAITGKERTFSKTGMVLGTIGLVLSAFMLVFMIIANLIINMFIKDMESSANYTSNNIAEITEIDEADEIDIISDVNPVDERHENVNPSDYDPILSTGDEISRTFMIYLIGSDLETEYGSASLDISELIEANIDFTWNNIIIQTGGTREWMNDVISSDKTEIYEVVQGGITRVADMPVRNMASPDTLTDFLEFCYSNYQTDAYSLILWNHGAGPMVGYGYDEIANDILTLPQLIDAMENSPFGLDNKLEFIGFDACLMSSIEVGFAFANYADYMIASQELVPGWGWDYSFFSDIEPTMTTEGVAITIIDHYYEFCDMLFGLRPDFVQDVSMSCLNLSNISVVENELNNLYAKAGNSLNANNFPSAALIRSNVKSFGTANSSAYYDLIDMQHLCQLMREDYTSEATNLDDALSRLIVYNRTNIPNSGGVSIYYPYDDKELMDDLFALYDTFDFADDYAGYIQRFIALLQDKPDIDWNMSKAISGQEGEAEYFVQLTPEQINTYDTASFLVIFKLMDDSNYEGYYVLFISSDVTLDKSSGRLFAHYEGKTHTLLDPDTGETGFIQMREQEVTDTYIRYYLPAVLMRFSTDWKSEAAKIQIETDRDGGNIKLLSVIPFPDEDNPHVAGRRTIDIYEFEFLSILCGGRDLSYNDDGSLKPFGEWESTGKFIGSEIKLNPETRDSLVLVQEEVSDELECYMVINIRDVYGNVYSSDLIPIQ